MTAHLELTVDVDAPVEATWAGAVDWDHQGEWMLGTTVRGTAQVGRLGFLDTMVITTWEPPHRCYVLHTGKVVRGTGEFEVRDRGQGRSTFVWREDLELPLGALGRAGWPVIKPVFALGVQKSLEKFARWVERGQRPA